MRGRGGYEGETDVFALEKREGDPAEEIVTVDGGRIGLGRVSRDSRRGRENRPSRVTWGGGQRDARWVGGKPYF